MLNRAKCISIILIFITFSVLLSGCPKNKHATPKQGIWATDDKLIFISCEKPEDSYVTIDGVKYKCGIENPKYSNNLWFYATTDLSGVYKQGDELCRGKTVSLDEEQWVIDIEGIVFYLRQLRTP